MFDIRPVGYVIGLLVVALGATMLAPMLADISAENDHWPVFLESAVITVLIGGLISISCQNSVSSGLTIRQTFLLTTLVWFALPLFGALPFVIGHAELTFTDAFSRPCPG